MPSTIAYSGYQCASGVLVPFSGFSLPLNNNYRVEFACISRLPNSSISLSPTGFYITPAETSPIFSTIFKAVNGFTKYNSSSNIIKLSIFNRYNTEIYRDYAAVNCGNLSNDPIQQNPTPTITPSQTVTPTITPTLTITPTPSVTPPIPFSASFDQLTQSFSLCVQNTVRGVAVGILGKTYQYSFTSDMINSDVTIGNTTGTVTITSNPTYVYTTLDMNKRCDHYSLKFGLSDGSTTVQSVGFFRCGECS
jgi:hypothetical protein